MANIFTMLGKQAETKCYLSTEGDFYEAEKVENLLKKEYIAVLKDGSINIDKPFSDYRVEEIEKRFVTVASVEGLIRDLLNVPRKKVVPEE